jgi:hypothetical protein
MAPSTTDPTISPNLTLLSTISSLRDCYDGDDSLSPSDFLEDIIDYDRDELNDEAQWAELQVNPKETIDIPVVDLTEDNSLPYDDLLSQCITIPSSPCSSIKGASDNEDDNESLPDLTSGESCLSSEIESCPTNTISYNPVEPNEDTETQPRTPRIKLRLNPPKPKILLRLKQVPSKKSCCRVGKNGRRTKKLDSLNHPPTSTGRKRGTRIWIFFTCPLHNISIDSSLINTFCKFRLFFIVTKRCSVESCPKM